MNIYISCPWNFSKGLDEVKKYLKSNNIVDNITSSPKEEPYNSSKLEKADAVIFILEKFAWTAPLASLSRGLLSEITWCINNKKQIFIVYRASKGLDIYSAVIDENMNISGKPGTGGSIFKILNIMNQEYPMTDESIRISSTDSSSSIRIPEHHFLNPKRFY